MNLKIFNVSFILTKRLEKGLRFTSLIFRVGDPKFFYRQLVRKYKKLQLKNIKITEPTLVDKFLTNKLEINGKLKISTREGGKKIMFKKVFGAVMALAFVFGMATQTNIVSSGSDVSSYACCDHDGDVWDW